MNRLWIIFMMLVVIRLLSFVSGHTFGGVVHILLVIAVAVLVIRLIQRRKL